MPKFNVPVELEAVCKWYATITIVADSEEEALEKLSDAEFEECDDLDIFMDENNMGISHDMASLTVQDYYSKIIDEDSITVGD